jgi:hypothetical protein
VSERSLRLKHQLKSGGYGLASGVHPSRFARWGTLGTDVFVEPGGHGEELRRIRGKAAGAKLGTSPVNRFTVNTGTAPVIPTHPEPIRMEGKIRRRSMLLGWGGGAVVVAGVTTGHEIRESRNKGEGLQRVRNKYANWGGHL